MFFPNAPQKGSRFKVGVQGSRRRREVVAFVDASVRNRSQASAERRTCVGHASDMPETKIVAKRRTVVTFYVSYYKSVNSQRDRGGPGRETQHCRHFWTRLGSSRLKSVNSHRDRGVLGGKRSTVVTFGLASGERRGERREEKREMRGEKRGERREERRKERDERREKRGEKRDERREERRERREKRRERREEKREERGERRGEWIEERREEIGDRREKRGERRGERGERG